VQVSLDCEAWVTYATADRRAEAEGIYDAVRSTDGSALHVRLTRTKGHVRIIEKRRTV
jgi:hypothetical protein